MGRHFEARMVAIMALCWVGLTGVPAEAQSQARSSERLASRHYARGVQYLTQGRYSEAQRELDFASSYAPEDARVYFMRGMSKLRQGATYDAEADFQYGASVEVEHGRGDVGVALQRLQGSERLTIERYRREAKKMAALASTTTPRENGKTAEKAEQTSSSQAKKKAPSSPKTRRSDYRLTNLQPDESDPFADSANGFLGRGDLQAARNRQALDIRATPDSASDDSSELVDEDPIGSGIDANATGSTTGDAMDDAFDADDADDADDAEMADADSSKPSTPSGGREKRGVLGAALRAMMRSLPGESLTRQGQQLMPKGIGIGSPPQGGLPPADSESADEGFADPDPFAAEADPMNDTIEEDASTESQELPESDSAPMTDEDVDPFADEE